MRDRQLGMQQNSLKELEERRKQTEVKTDPDRSARAFCCAYVRTGSAYPIRSAVDVAVSLLLFACAMIFAKRQNLTLLAACFLGAIVPDVVDLAPAIVNHHLGWSLPVVKLFPWHWHRYSGSIYDGSRAVESLSLHLAVVALSAIFLYSNRRSLFSFGGEHGHVAGG